MRWDELELETLAVRAGIHRSQFNEHSEAMYLTSSFVFKNAAEAAARFSGEDPGMVYSRYTNPTVSAMQERLAALEGAECCVATASGMSAILGCVMALLKAGDHIVASRSIFGATVQLFGGLLPVQFVGLGEQDMDRFAARCKPFDQPDIEFGQGMPHIHDHHQAAQLLTIAQVTGDQRLPVYFHVARDFGVTISGEIDEKAAASQAEIIDVLRATGRLADERQAVAVRQRIERARLAGVGAPRKCDFCRGSWRQFRLRCHRGEEFDILKQSGLAHELR